MRCKSRSCGFFILAVFVAGAVGARPLRANVFYGTNTAGGVLYRISSTGAASVFVSGLNNPSALAVAPDGNVFVQTTTTSDLASDRMILLVTPQGSTSTVLSGLPNPYFVGSGFNTPPRAFYDGLAVDSHGDLFIANPPLGFPEAAHQTVPPALPVGVLELKTDGTLTNIAQDIEPLALAIDRQDNLFASMGDSWSISKITPTGVNSTFYTNPAFKVTSLVADSQGNLIFNSLGLVKLNPQGQFTTLNAGVGGALGIDRNDNVLVASDGLYKVSPSGVAVKLSSFSFANHIAILVPEPSSWILLGLGAGLFAAFRALRKR